MKTFLDLLKDILNSGFQHKGKTWQWDKILLNNVQKLCRLLGKTELPDYNDLYPNLTRDDTLATRKRILELAQKQDRELNISKSTLHELLVHAKSDGLSKVHENSCQVAVHTCLLGKFS